MGDTKTYCGCACVNVHPGCRNGGGRGTSMTRGAVSIVGMVVDVEVMGISAFSESKTASLLPL